ncbi:MAG: hypothetical protein IT381_10530 [Deltaproteobacteria bacterium]|nr:hypothetical protein [Deltaproteobacteria bacterium]
MRRLGLCFAVAAALTGCIQRVALRGLVYVSGDEKPSYSSNAGGGQTGSPYLEIFPIPSPSAAALTIAFEMRPRSALKQLNATLYYDDAFEDVLLDANASVAELAFPQGRFENAKVRLRAVLTTDEVLIVDSNAFVVDGALPETSIDAVPALVAGSQALPVVLRCTDPDVVTRECRFAAPGFPEIWGSASAVTLPIEDTLAATVVCRCIDSVGNVAFATSNAFDVDATPPVITVTPRAAFYGASAPLSIVWTASDAFFGATPIALSFSCDAGQIFTPIESAIANLGAYAWTTPSLAAGACRVRATATDLVGHSASAESADFAIDGTIPALALTAPVGGEAIGGAALTSVTWTVSDTHLGAMPVVLELSTDSGASYAPFAGPLGGTGYAWTTPDIDLGTCRVRASATDAVGNTAMAASSADFAIDGAPPVVTLLTFTGGESVRGGVSTPIQWSATDSHAVTVSLAYSLNGGMPTTIAGPIANSGTYAWTPPSLNNTNARIHLTATDPFGNAVTVSSPAVFAIDISTPLITPGQMTINGGSNLTTANNNVAVSFQAGDATTNLTHFCLKTNGTAPNLADACWLPLNGPSPGVTPAPSITVTDYYYRVGYTAVTYSVYVWVHDAAGNISSNSGVLGTDRQTVKYQPGVPALFVDVSNAASDGAPEPPNELTPSDLTAPLASAVYVKWTIAPGQTFGAGPIALQATTDNLTWTTVASALANGDNDAAAPAGCTTTAKFSGCYKWTNTVASTYVKLRLAATNTNGMVTFAQMQPLNVGGTVNILAGDVEPGSGASVQSAQLFVGDSFYSGRAMHSLVVMPDGVIYFSDSVRGLLKIDPATGILSPLIPIGPSGITGNGGPATAATLGSWSGIIADYDGNILIWDEEDGSPGQIRRLNHATQQIDLYIGGGLSSADGVDPLNVAIATRHNIPKFPTFYAAPNGDVYFESDVYSGGGKLADNSRLRIYSPTTGLVTSLKPTNTSVGSINYPGVDFASCWGFGFGLEFDLLDSSRTKFWDSFYCPVAVPYFDTSAHDPITGATQLTGGATGFPYDRGGNFTALDGKSYTISSYDQVRRTSDNTLVLGTGTPGRCADGTPWQTCNMNLLDYFVTQNGDVYFVEGSDRGAVIRTVNKDDDKVYTIAGKYADFGDGGRALRARFHSPLSVHIRNDPPLRVLVYDDGNRNLREFKPGDDIALVAGNGANTIINTTIPATQSGIYRQPYYPNYMAINEANGDAFYAAPNGSNINIWRLDRTLGQWAYIGGNGGTLIDAADTMPIANVNVNNFFIMGFDATGFLGWGSRLNGNATMAYMKHYTLAPPYTQSHVAGDGSTVPLYIPPATPEYFCPRNNTIPTASCTIGVPTQGGLLPAQWDAGNNRWLFAGVYKNELVSLPIGGNAQIVTLLAETPGGGIAHHGSGASEAVYYCSASYKLRKYSVQAATDTVLPLPPGMRCGGYTMAYSDTRNSLIFLFNENAMTGVAEYIAP